MNKKMEYFEPYENYYQLFLKMTIPDYSRVNQMVSNYESVAQKMLDSIKGVEHYEDYQKIARNVISLSKKVMKTITKAKAVLGKVILETTNLDDDIKKLRLKNIQLDTAVESYNKAFSECEATPHVIDEVVIDKKGKEWVHQIVNPAYLEIAKKVRLLEKTCNSLREACTELSAKISEEIARIKECDDVEETALEKPATSIVTPVIEEPKPIGCNNYTSKENLHSYGSGAYKVNYHVYAPQYEEGVEKELPVILYFPGTDGVYNALNEPTSLTKNLQEKVQSGEYPEAIIVFIEAPKGAENNNKAKGYRAQSILQDGGVIDQVLQEYHGDANRVSATGFSDGAASALTLAGIEASGKYAKKLSAVAPVAGSTYKLNNAVKSNLLASDIPVLAYNSTADGNIKYKDAVVPMINEFQNHSNFSWHDATLNGLSHGESSYAVYSGKVTDENGEDIFTLLTSQNKKNRVENAIT